MRGPSAHDVDDPPEDALPAVPGSARDPSETERDATEAADPAAPWDAGSADDAPVPAVDPEAYASARVVVPRVLGLTGARSIVHVGSASGAWSQACRDLGVPEVVGVDGAHVPDGQRGFGTEFVERDLAEPLDLDRRFNMVICVDVGENLPAERAPGLVGDLTSLAPIVLFSAAVPGQGDGHVNEQWPEHWVALFEAEGWTCRDAVRPWIRTNEQVAWWHRQSLFLAAAPQADPAYQSFPKLDSIRIPTPVDYLCRPDGDVISPPTAPAVADSPPREEPATPPPPSDAAPTPDTGAGTETDAAPTLDTPVPTTTGPSDSDSDDAEAGHGGDADAQSRTDADNADFWGTSTRRGDEIDHPRPPGWDALKRITRRARRRGSDD